MGWRPLPGAPSAPVRVGDTIDRDKLLRYFRPRRKLVVGAAGRLSPEKGFDVLVRAAEQVAPGDGSVGFILFGEGPCRAQLVQQVNAAGLKASFVLSGFRADLDRFVPHLDVLVLPSHTEGLPNVVLEACAAAVPVVATAVGGTPEVIIRAAAGEKEKHYAFPHFLPDGGHFLYATYSGT